MGALDLTDHWVINIQSQVGLTLVGLRTQLLLMVAQFISRATASMHMLWDLWQQVPTYQVDWAARMFSTIAMTKFQNIGL